MNYIGRFLNGKWLRLAATYIVDPAKMKILVDKAKKYVGRKGLDNAKAELEMLVDFVRSIAKGTYRDYSKGSLLMAVAALIYVVSPLDIVPDFLVGLGFLDDIAIVTWALTKISAEIDKYKAAIMQPQSASATSEAVPLALPAEVSGAQE